MAVAITPGSGASSVASEAIAGLQYQQIKVVDGTAASTNLWKINNDGSSNVSVGSSVLVAGNVGLTGSPSISGAVTIIGTPSVSGTVNIGNGSVVAFEGGGWTTSIVSSTPSSVLVGASIFGQLPAGTAPLGSVATLQGTNPWVIISVGSVVSINTGSIIATQVGSVITVFQAPSIVGTYAEDAASSSGDKGFLVMGARNDTLASVTSADGDYSSHVVGPAGELIAENAPLTKWVSGTASMLGGVPLTSSVTVIAAQGSSVFTYITSAQVANLGSASVLVGFYGGTSSLIAYTIAPAGGGSNLYFQNGIKTNANSAFAASVSGTASVFLSAQGFISKT